MSNVNQAAPFSFQRVARQAPLSDKTREVVRNNILKEADVQKMAQQCGMSLSTFKTEFRRYYHTSPHKWFTAQRLSRARLQLITTRKTVATIAAETRFNTPSLFI